jgi:hypothetical protein
MYILIYILTYSTLDLATADLVVGTTGGLHICTEACLKTQFIYSIYVNTGHISDMSTS